MEESTFIPYEEAKKKLAEEFGEGVFILTSHGLQEKGVERPFFKFECFHQGECRVYRDNGQVERQFPEIKLPSKILFSM